MFIQNSVSEEQYEMGGARRVLVLITSGPVTLTKTSADWPNGPKESKAAQGCNGSKLFYSMEAQNET